MAIAATDLKCYRSAVVNDTNSNGGRMSATEELDGLYDSLWPDVSETQRTDGAVQYRKVFWKIANADSLTLINARIGLLMPTPGDDRLYFFEGTQDDLQDDITSPDHYGSAALQTAALIADDHLHVTVESSSVILFRDTDLIRISDRPTLDGVGNEEFHRITGTPTINGSTVSMNLVGTLANNYATTATYVSSLIEIGDVTANFTGKVVTSAAGTFDLTAVLKSAIGAVEDTFTFTFTSSTAFSVAGTLTGALAAGSINSNYAPNNPSLGSPYFTIPAAAWGGTWLANDILVFVAHPASIPIWECRTVPAGAGTISQQSRTAIILGESGSS